MKQKVIVAMSGGVDSSVAAALLKDRGYEVIGITLNLFGDSHGEMNPPQVRQSRGNTDRSNISCCGAVSGSNKARKVCDILGIRHYQKNCKELFYKNVIERFVKEYFQGRTPNPCVECNRLIKFSYLFSIARQIGADFLATGHYARITPVKSPDVTSGVSPEADNFTGVNGSRVLMRGRDSAKDQSYFLYCLNAGQLKNIIFPLGDLTKTEVRDIAGKLNLPTAREKESRDICFIPDGDCFNFLKSFIGRGTEGDFPTRRRGVPIQQSLDGKIRDTEGRILGSHKGFFGFTIGQRRRTGISQGERRYVVSVNPDRNEVVVGRREDANVRSFIIKDMNYLTENMPQIGQRFHIQIRYKQKPCDGEIVQRKNDSVRVRFDEPQFAVTCGQSAVLYNGEIVIGGGIIDEVEKADNRRQITDSR